MKAVFRWSVTFIAGLALLLDGLALADYFLHPLAGDFHFHSALYRAITVLILLPVTLLVAFLIIRRVPGNIVGLFLIMWSGTIAKNSIHAEIGAGWYGAFYAYDLMFGWFGLFLMFLHFPNGQIYPRRIARWVYVLFTLFVPMAGILFFSSLSLNEDPPISNPFVVSAWVPYINQLTILGLLLFTPILVMGPVSLFLRYRKGRQIERQQIKWLTLFAVIMVVYSIPALILYPLAAGKTVMEPGTGLIGLLFYFINGFMPPLVIGVAVLRFRLWDIDHLIRRTLLYSSLTLVLALIYFSCVVFLQTLFSFLFQFGSNDLAIVLSTLAIFTLFTPLRRRIQENIDRRFFRPKYNFDLTVARFAAAIRSQVKLKPIEDALVAHVEETLHPEGIWLWQNLPPPIRK
jgi:hypothetical protein